ncbi:MAG: hypothetical protein IJ167_00715, partial [Lachnospiraceae bacterium]|nr:hypothetical protein [Lachnospiraceae bacterium]
IVFNNFVIDLYKNSNKYKDFLKIEPDWKTLDQKSISLIVSSMYHLARKTEWKMKVYSWMLDEKFILKEPYFALNAKGMLKVILLQESPKDFRRNNIYVSANVLEKV